MHSGGRATGVDTNGHVDALSTGISLPSAADWLTTEMTSRLFRAI